MSRKPLSEQQKKELKEEYKNSATKLNILIDESGRIVNDADKSKKPANQYTQNEKDYETEKTKLRRIAIALANGLDISHPVEKVKSSPLTEEEKALKEKNDSEQLAREKKLERIEKLKNLPEEDKRENSSIRDKLREVLERLEVLENLVALKHSRLEENQYDNDINNKIKEYFGLINRFEQSEIKLGMNGSIPQEFKLSSFFADRKILILKKILEEEISPISTYITKTVEYLKYFEVNRTQIESYKSDIYDVLTELDIQIKKFYDIKTQLGDNDSQVVIDFEIKLKHPEWRDTIKFFQDMKKDENNAIAKQKHHEKAENQKRLKEEAEAENKREQDEKKREADEKKREQEEENRKKQQEKAAMDAEKEKNESLRREREAEENRVAEEEQMRKERKEKTKTKVALEKKLSDWNAQFDKEYNGICAYGHNYGSNNRHITSLKTIIPQFIDIKNEINKFNTENSRDGTLQIEIPTSYLLKISRNIPEAMGLKCGDFLKSKQGTLSQTDSDTPQEIEALKNTHGGSKKTRRYKSSKLKKKATRRRKPKLSRRKRR